MIYKSTFGKRLNLKNPVTFNEKLMWLKLNEYIDNDLVTICADKYKVREYIKEKGCEELLNDLIGVYNNSEEIEWKKLPNEFVIKCNHGAGYNIICKDKQKLEEKEVKAQLNKWMKEDYWKLYAETNYKKIPKKIICEKLLKTNSNTCIEDYKIYCFNGGAEYVMVCLDRDTAKTKYYFYDKNWNFMKNMTKDGIRSTDDIIIKKPENIDLMFEYANKLSKPFKFVRVDFYNVEGKIYFGELTFTPSGCLDKNRLEETDKIFREKLKLE